MIYFFTSLCEQNLIIMMEIKEWKFTCVSDTLLLLLQQWEARRMMAKLKSENPSKETTLRIFFCPLSHATRQTRRRAVQQSLALFLSLILFDSTYTSAFSFCCCCLPVASSVYLSPSSNRSSSNIIHEETHRGAREKNLERATAFVSAEIWGLAKNLHWVSS